TDFSQTSSRSAVLLPGSAAVAPFTRLDAVVLFFEIMLVACVVLVTWFALYALYRLINDES
ncbi:hypothetical protein, partial [Mycolicibacterium thermoresistibile]